MLAPDAAAVGQTLALSDDESAHVARVLRLGAGDALRVFDGRGREWDARIVETSRTRVSVVVGAPAVPAPETRVRYTVALAVLKGDGTDAMVRDAVMMGAVRVCPFVSTRTEVRLATLERGERHERWRRIAVAAAKQCGRAVVPEVDVPATFADVVAAVDSDAARLLLVEPSLDIAARPVGSFAAPDAATLAIGPEGGWTPAEVAAALDRGWIATQLGSRRLRATSMALVALAACQAVWEGS